MNINIKQFCILLWTIVDPLYFRFTRLEHIEKECSDKTVMRVRLTRYRGRKITLSDGTVINKNDILLKIHLHNVKLLRQIKGFDSEIRRAFMIYKMVEESLPLIARYIQLHEYVNDIKGLVGITMLNKGCKKLGFETFAMHNRYYKLFKKASLLPIYYLSSNRALYREKPSPMYLFMSKEHLYNKYENA